MSKKHTREEIENTLLLASNNVNLKLQWIEGIYKDKNSKLTIQDNLGYKYYISYDGIKELANGATKSISKFDVSNVYTIYNINLLLKLNNYQWHIDTSCIYRGNYYQLKMINNNDENIVIKRNLCSIQYNVKKHIKFTCRKQRTPISYRKEIDELTNDEYSVLGDYVDCDTPILMRHNKCGCEWKVSPYSFVNMGTRCRECSGRIDTKERMNEILKEKTNGEYTIIGDFIDKEHKTLIRHNTCGYEWYATINNVLGYHFCPNCVSSYGEKLVKEYLINNKMKFVEQKRFNDCRDKYPLPFDFYLVDFNTCIEVQGRQHYFPWSFGSKEISADDMFKNVKRHDAIKKNYCLNNNIGFIEIKYDKFDKIDDIILNGISKGGD